MVFFFFLSFEWILMECWRFWRFRAGTEKNFFFDSKFQNQMGGKRSTRLHHTNFITFRSDKETVAGLFFLLKKKKSKFCFRINEYHQPNSLNTNSQIVAELLVLKKREWINLRKEITKWNVKEQKEFHLGRNTIFVGTDRREGADEKGGRAANDFLESAKD